MKLKTRQITVTAILLAICIVSQFFKKCECIPYRSDHQRCPDSDHCLCRAGMRHYLKYHHPDHILFHHRKPDYGSHSGNVSMHYNRKCNSRPCCCPAPQKIRGKSRTSGICCDRCCIKGSVYGNSYFSYYLTKYVACENAANVTCSAAAVFCHAADYCPDRRGVCNHYSCNIAKYHSR